MKNKSLYNFLLSTAGFILFGFLKPDQVKLIKKNKIFKNAYVGKRCFILGNGPSLKDVNFKDLKDEYVFTVNQLMRRNDFGDLHTDFHLWSDFDFFNLDMEKEEDAELLEMMKKVNTEDNKPLCFFPADMKGFVNKYELDKNMNINYFKARLKFYEGFDADTDFSKFVPSFSTVIHYAILLAVYMGFREICLLGCDSTSIVVQIKSFLKSNDEKDYAYNLSENEKKRMYRMLEKKSLEEYANSFWHLLLSYRVLFRYCRNRGIQLYNCSSQTVIDSIPRKKLSEVLSDPADEIYNQIII